jgi:hypothetical protein
MKQIKIGIMALSMKHNHMYDAVAVLWKLKNALNQMEPYTMSILTGTNKSPIGGLMAGQIEKILWHGVWVKEVGFDYFPRRRDERITVRLSQLRQHFA